jgi:multidrug efflux pump subunit AcrA (membrane-fusion protein)
MIRRSAGFTVLLALVLPVMARAETELTVQLTEISEQKAVFASVESVDVTRARTRIAGTVRELVVDEGSLVKRGQRLALVVDAKLKLGLAALDARLASLAARRGLASSTILTLLVIPAPYVWLRDDGIAGEE